MRNASRAAGRLSRAGRQRLHPHLAFSARVQYRSDALSSEQDEGFAPCGRGGIGRRSGLKIRRPYGHVGSSPTARTIIPTVLPLPGLRQTAGLSAPEEAPQPVAQQAGGVAAFEIEVE